MRISLRKSLLCIDVDVEGSTKSWGGAIFIYSNSHTVKTKEILLFLKESSNVEHEYMNVPP